LRSVLLAIAAAFLLAACGSPAALTAQAVECEKGDVEILDSNFKREGVTTAWCARCKDKVFQCASTPARDRVECREAKPGTPCN
jgi:hypothetical protein